MTISECTYLDFEKEYDKDGKFWCETKYEWHYADEAECWRFCKAYSRSSNVAKSYREYSSNKQQSISGCYITTIVCEILNLDDNNYYLNSLRKFRNEVLQKSDKYKEILVEYDVIGPLIANKLRNDSNKEIIALNLFNIGISKVVEFINKNDIIKAIKLYTDMTKLLIEGYNINRVVSIDEINAADINNSGHGKYIKL